eukprot:CAMPEP_0197031566 /NCGR_PEP_ID=MMETSP1384-20130603/10538_1 /TAXON_ID=29189 /ORGANISM="Ammonia sp." /LENGTH=502 /DNA_ID=CAMNT_0042461109 /DNA_START=28 /DNA_END=1536 /DNA_ORIENTATION=-
MADESPKSGGMPPTYKASLSTGIFGAYTIANNASKRESNEPAREYIYYPSISSGVFGTWLYNDSSPSQPKAPKVPKVVVAKKAEPQKSKMGAKYWAPSFGRKKQQPESYKFEIKGARNEPIRNGKRYNVKLLQEYTLPPGKEMQKLEKQARKQQKKEEKQAQKKKQKEPAQQASDDNKQQQNDENKNDAPNDAQPASETGKLFICDGSVVHFSGECIINAANEGMLGGGGVDGAISDAGGDALYYLRKQVPTVSGSKHTRCRTGDAKITQSGYPYNRLKCDYVIHAVGPNYSMLYRGYKSMNMKDIDKLLYDSYANSMLLCKQYNIKTVGFCLISSGIFRGPRSLDDVLRIGIEAIRDYMFAGIEVYIIGFTHSELSSLVTQSPQILGAMTNEYAQVQQQKGWGAWGGGRGWSKGGDSDSGSDEGEGSGGFMKGVMNMFGKGKTNNNSSKKGKPQQQKRGAPLGPVNRKGSGGGGQNKKGSDGDGKGGGAAGGGAGAEKAKQ